MRNKRNWHKNFIQYMKFIVEHKNYSDLPNKFRTSGEILWVSPSDKLRALWWDKKVKNLKVSNRAEVARIIHPKELKGIKPCQICGKGLSIFYIYPNKNTLKKLNMLSSEFQFTHFQETVSQIIDIVANNLGEEGMFKLKSFFNVPIDLNNKDAIIKYIQENRKTKLSPGAMCNPPDRLDGFHTYNACCRSLEDTGRHSSNLARYSQDRRVYENWAEGNWNLSNRIMGEFNKFNLEIECPLCGKVRKMTADHIGPISLGFTHNPRFNPLCQTCNSKKNNRMSYKDVETLISYEKKGEKVISWHSKYIWDMLKHNVKDEYDALKLSKLMRKNLHYILILFSKISEKGFDKFLIGYLHPEFSFVDYKFRDFHPLTGPKEVIAKPLDSKNKEKNAKRYIRISFDSLERYKNIENRNSKIWNSVRVDTHISSLLDNLSKKNNSKAILILEEILLQLAIEAKTIFDVKS